MSATEILHESNDNEEALLREQVKRTVGVNFIKSCRELDLSYTIRDTLFIYLMLAVAIFGACYFHSRLGPAVLYAAPAFALLTGIAFNWINVQIHEASHRLLFRGRALNDAYCNIVLGAWALQDVQSYRAVHGMHHAHLHTSRDPDLWVYTSNTGTLRHMLRGICEDLALVTAIRRFGQTMKFTSENDVALSGTPLYATIAKVIAQLIVVSIFVLWCGWWGLLYYGAFYLYGLLGVFPVLVRIRTVVQHHDDHVTGSIASDAPFVSRSTVAPLVQFIVVGARMDYHFEHHLFPMLPYYNLRKIHDALVQAGFFENWRKQTGRTLRTDNYLKAYTTLAT